MTSETAADEAAETTEAETPVKESPVKESPVKESPVEEGPAAESSAADVSAATDASDDTAETAEPQAGRPRERAPMLLGGAAVLLAAFAVVAGIQAHSLHSQASQNTALTDAAATRQVQQQVASAIDTVFSYNYASTGATRAAAQRLLTGPAVRQYDSLFKLVEQDAPAQHLVLTTKVTSSGVELLQGDRARVLIFADQRDTRMTTKQTTYAGAMIAVNAVQQGGRWKIENIDTFTGS